MKVRVWDAESGQCMIVHNFGRPIASLAFHASGDYLAVASGHKVSPRRRFCSGRRLCKDGVLLHFSHP
jgi:WD40 repeat protein